VDAIRIFIHRHYGRAPMNVEQQSQALYLKKF